MKRALIIAMIVAACILIRAQPADCCWAASPLETRLMESNVVVVGRIVAVREGFWSAHDSGTGGSKRLYLLGKIEVGRVLRGPEALRHLEIAFPERRYMSTDLLYAKGEEGVWILRWDPERNCYWTGRPDNFMNLAYADTVVQTLERLHQQLDGYWGPAQEGLQLALMVRPSTEQWSQPRSGEAFVTDSSELQFYIRNTTDKPLTYVRHCSDHTLTVEVRAPNGREVEMFDPDAFLGDSVLEVMPQYFRTLLPGQAQLLAFTRHLTLNGTYHLRATYRNIRLGTDFGFADVWTGKISSETLVVHAQSSHIGPRQ